MRLTSRLSLTVLMGSLVLWGCSNQQPFEAADSIYVGGDLITMNDRQPTAEALAVKGALILAVGTRAEIEQAHRGPTTQIIDLGGKTLLPGFLDAHSPLRQLADRREPGQRLRASRRPWPGSRKHRGGAREVP
jgi:imidazolonepropionase-like amidohydrolase